MGLLEHCRIRINNLKEFRDSPRDTPLHPDRIRFINGSIEVNEKLMKMVEDNPHLRFSTKYPDVLGEIY